MDIGTCAKLNNGVEMPMMGLGMWRAEGEESIQSASWALQAGYRLLDTAAFYFNEQQVGQAVCASGLKREEVFVTTKLWNADQLNGTQRQALDASLKTLNLDYIDLYLIHWPVPGKYQETWKLMEEFYQSGKIRAIGVSNFQQHHLEDILETATIVPAVNQIELHPHLAQVDLCNFCQFEGIAVQSWRPLGGGKSDLLIDPVIGAIAQKHSKTHAQVILRWNLQRGIHIIPKSVNQERIIQNANLFDFMLTDDEIAAITALNIDARYGEDPDNMTATPKLMAH